MNKLLTTFCLVFLFVSVAFSQGELPDVIPPSPEAAEFQKYGEFPVDYSTGIPDISIPIYNLRSGQLSVPMSISYHASGIKVEDISSVVGLGWNLNVGGMVSRTILDLPDENSRRTHYRSEAQYQAAIAAAAGDIPAKIEVGHKLTHDFYNDARTSSRDNHSDRYFYQLPGGPSGIFRYNFLVGEGGNDTEMEVITLPYRNYVIEQLRTDETNPQILGFHIVNDNGTKYYYETEECRTHRANGRFYPTTWHISKIISADDVDTIQFIYASFNNEYGKIEKAESFSINIQQHNCGFGHFSPSWSYNRVLCTPLVETIITKNAVVRFDYKGDRRDVNGGIYRVSKISVFDRYSMSKKHSFAFHQSYFGRESDNNERMRLDKIVINDGSSNQGTYGFVYDSRTLPPNLENWGYDHWGYYNNRIIEPGSIRKLLHGPYLDDDRIDDIYKGNRHPEGDAKQCMLEEIHYPTGGKTVFTFERHKLSGFVYDYTNPSGLVDYGGLRIRNIKNYTSEGALAFERTYGYTFPKFQPIERSLYQYLIVVWRLLEAGDGGGCIPPNSQITSSSTLVPLEPVKYGSVVEILGSEENNIGKTSYTYEIPDPNFNRSELEYEFVHRFKHIYHNDYGMRNPVLRFKREYNNENSLVKTTEFKYVKHRTGPEYEYPTGVHIVNLADWSEIPSAYECEPCCEVNPFQCFIHYYLAEHEYHDTKAYDEHTLLEAEVVTDNISNLKTETLYFYDNLTHTLPTRKTITTSTGMSRSTDYTYITDLSGGVYDELKSKNILTPVVQQVTYNGDRHLETVTTNYTIVDGYPVPKPENVEIIRGSDPAADPVRILYHKYDDKGNILEVSRENDVHTCYVWGYGQSLPVAKIENATYAEIESILDVSSIQNLNGQALRDALAPLRTSLSNALVTIFTYDPLAGVVSQTDPNGKVMTYDYNDVGQLEQVKDSGDLTRLIFYQYKPKN